MKKIVAIAAAFALCLALGACSGGGDSPDSEEGQTDREKLATIDYAVAEGVQEYAQGDLRGASYRVSVPAEATDDELQGVFADVVADDEFDVHTVWFYSDAKLADGTVAYDVASAVQDAPDAEPVILRASDEAKAKAQEALAAKGSE